MDGDIGPDHYYSDVSPTKGTLAPTRRSENSAKLKSIIVSPSNDRDEVIPIPHEKHAQPHVVEDEETLQEFQNRAKRRTRTPARNKSPRNSPNILYGVSLKKRKLSQLSNSPNNARTMGETPTKKCRRNVSSKTVAGTSKTTQNPPIKLIPAMTKGKSDFRAPPPRVP